MNTTMTVAELRQELDAKWRQACEYDGMPEGTKFAIFSADNPFYKEYQKLMGRWMFAQQAIAAINRRMSA